MNGISAMDAAALANIAIAADLALLEPHAFLPTRIRLA
jgi:hypothetical protein